MITMTMYYFSTYFDINYLPRALCLLDSLERHCESFKVYALCLDDICLKRVKELGRLYVVPIGLAELEAAVTVLSPLKYERSRVEYYFTCGPAFMYYVMDQYREVDILTHLDADLYFFSNPQPLFELFNGHSIGVIPHNLPQYNKKAPYGKYNVGWVSFRRDVDGLACLRWWRDRCIEWCYERFEDEKYADQLYLEKWPDLFNGFYAFGHHGANVGAWNVGDYQLSIRENKVFVDDDPLIFYHFHGFRKIANNIYNSNMALTLKSPSSILKHNVFTEYINLLEYYSAGQNPTASLRNYRSKSLLKNIIRFFLGLIFRQYILIIKDRVI